MMHNWLKWLRYNLWYFRQPPWETGITPPEVMQFVQSHPPGRAIDLGCGSGTNGITLARAGWQVTGVDFAMKAIGQARRKLAQAGLPGEFLQRDVTALDDLHHPFNLILDIGCFHGLSGEKKARYQHNLLRLLSPGGSFLLYGFLPDPPTTTGISAADLARFQSGLTLISEQTGTDRHRQSIWLEFIKSR